MYACVWIATLPFRQQKSQSFFPNPWQTWIGVMSDYRFSHSCRSSAFLGFQITVPKVEFGSSFIEWVGAKGVFRVHLVANGNYLEGITPVGWWKHEQNCRCINMFVFVHFMWYDTWEQCRRVRMRSASCNLMLLGQMLPRALTTNPVSESGSVVAAFLMFWSDAARMVAASIVLFPGMHLNLSRSHSHDLMIFS